MPAQQTSRVLIVDDDRMNRDILVELLDEDGYHLVTTVNGFEALAELERTGPSFDAVLLDRTMPGIDGLEVLRRIKATAALQWVPVIMQTAAATHEQVLEGIAAGAFCYLTKPFDLDLLRTLVRSAVAASRAQRSLRAQVEQSRILIGLMDCASFTIRTPDEARRLAVLVANAAPSPQQAVLGLTELLLNAIEHGNLGLGGEDKLRLCSAGAWAAEVARRLALPENAQRTVTLELRRCGRSVEVLIADQGSGFDWRPYLDLDCTRAFHAHGRGIALARRLSFESLEYLGNGSRVRGRFAAPAPVPQQPVAMSA